MSTALLQELHKELRRVYIAGSELATGDMRLKRLLPQFQQLGQRAPVFSKLGQGIAALIEPSDGTASSSGERLQEVSTLLASVLRTLGASAESGTLQSIAHQSNQLKTISTYRKLAPVVEALSTSGGGRYEVITDAFKNGVFNDLRLMQLAVGALDDSYSDISEYTAKHILPAYGRQILPYMLEVFDPNGKSADCRRLHVIAEVGGEEVIGQLLEWAETGSSEVRAVAIEHLAGREEYVDRLIAWTSDKKKAVRESAYGALAHCKSEAALAHMMESFKGKDGELVRDAAYYSENRELDTLIVHALDAVMKSAHEAVGDEKKLARLREEAENYFEVLRSKRLEQLYDTYLYVAQHAQFYADIDWLILIYDQAVEYLENMGTTRELGLLFAIEKQAPKYIPYAFRTAARLLEPQALYERYYGFIAGAWREEKKNEFEARIKLVESAMEELFWEQARSYEASLGQVTRVSYKQARFKMPVHELWDGRWLDCAMEWNALELLAMLARPDHEGCKAYITEQLQLKEKHRDGDERILLLLRAFDRAQMDPEIKWEALVCYIENPIRFKNYYFDRVLIAEYFEQLPAKYKSRIEAVVPMHSRYSKEQLKELLESMSDNIKE
ncbi:HEAT repeat domain-containing protein [Paenibacillus sp. J5C_2022]|uniref:HEAT repeat domain-containing protein n=1 Tax=Paenibacillus sp. J5C2022 TaxID=2977129 RepID=UPI0021D12355|nr:HEAT repeat domain-containing protein [Paenibacillus sp. J5C2022]MCU6711892.1 HEAT repeat domain-containing protein [Paenibacillus sp. J5C2022]